MDVGPNPSVPREGKRGSARLSPAPASDSPLRTVKQVSIQVVLGVKGGSLPIPSTALIRSAV